MDGFLTREQAAKKLNISTRTLDRYVQRKIIRGHKKGKRTVFRENDVNAVLQTPNQKAEVITEEKSIAKPNEEILALTGFLQQMHGELQQKDAHIAHLNFELGKHQEIAKNSLPLLEGEKKDQNITVLKQSLQSARMMRSFFLGLFALSVGGIIILVGMLFF